MLGQRVILTRSYSALGLRSGETGVIIDTDVLGGVLVKFDRSKFNFWLRANEYEMVREEDPLEDDDFGHCTSVEEEVSKYKSDGGGGQNYYDLPAGAKQLQDLIEYRNMNGNVKDIFKACYRLGEKEGTEELYDIRKMAYYSLRELGRRLGRKDYVNIAIEIIGHQHEGGILWEEA